MAATPDSDILSVLDRAGYLIDPGRRLRVLAILAELAARSGDLTDRQLVARHVAPLIASSPAESAAIFSLLCGPAAQTASHAPTPGQKNSAGRRRHTPARIAAIVAMALLFIANVAAVVFLYGTSVVHSVQTAFSPETTRAASEATSAASAVGPDRRDRQTFTEPRRPVEVVADDIVEAHRSVWAGPTLRELWKARVFESPPERMAERLQLDADTPLPLDDPDTVEKLLQQLASGTAVDLRERAGNLASASPIFAGARDVSSAISTLPFEQRTWTTAGLAAFIRANVQEAEEIEDADLARLAAGRAVLKGAALQISDAPWLGFTGARLGIVLRRYLVELALISTLLGSLACWAAIALRRRAYLERPGASETGRLIQTATQRRLPSWWTERRLTDLARDLAADRAPERRVDLARTVEATARAQGLFTLAERDMRRPVDLAFVVERQSREDQTVRRLEAIFEKLLKLGVRLQVYFFERAPDRIRAALGGPLRPLQNFASSLGGARLVLAGDTPSLTGGRGWRDAPWARFFADSGGTFVPLAPSDTWLDAESDFARELGLQLGDLSLTDLARPRTAPPSPSDAWRPVWATLDFDESGAPSRDALDRLDNDLRRFLGFHGLRWLQACAVYPIATWELTLALGQLLTDHAGHPLVTEERVGRLTSLPWMRSGEIPDWLRQHLIANLSPDDGASVRRFLAELLDDLNVDERPAGGRVPMRFAAEGSDRVHEDRLFVRFVRRAPQKGDRRAIEASRRLQRLLDTPLGERLRGFEAAPLFLGALAAGLLAPRLARELGLLPWADLTIGLTVVPAGVLLGIVLPGVGIASVRGIQLALAWLRASSTSPTHLLARFLRDLLLKDSWPASALQSDPLWLPAFFRRWLPRSLWQLEHAFERARASGKAEDDTRLRIFFVITLMCLGFFTLAIASTRASLFSDARDVEAPTVQGSSRSDLVDRNGALLATDLQHYGMYLDPRVTWDASRTRRDLLAALPDLDVSRLDRALRGTRRTFVMGALTPEQRARVMALGLPSVSFEPEQRRVYPLGSTAAHFIGFTDSGGDGLAGAEAALNNDIRATAASGDAVPLSLDLRVQAALEEELYRAVAEFKPKAGVGVVTDVHTGEILGLASWPTFDANRPARAGPDAQLNRAASSVYEMGSIFKGFTVAIGLDTGVATPASTFDARKPYQLGYRTIRDFNAAQKVLTLSEVFQYSSNIGTARLAMAVGPERMGAYFKALGLTTAAKTELLESTRPLTPKRWDIDAVASTSFGFGINVSPIALARAYGAIANGGELKPLTIRKLANGTNVASERALSEKTSREMLEIMRANVVAGSGRQADVSGLSVGGKTGIGTKYDPEIRTYNDRKTVSSFVAVFPTRGPVEAKRYLVFILLDEPQPTKVTLGNATGGWIAAPVAGRVIERIAPFVGVSRRTELTTPEAQPANAP